METIIAGYIDWIITSSLYIPYPLCALNKRPFRIEDAQSDPYFGFQTHTCPNCHGMPSIKTISTKQAPAQAKVCLTTQLLQQCLRSHLLAFSQHHLTRRFCSGSKETSQRKPTTYQILVCLREDSSNLYCDAWGRMENKTTTIQLAELFRPSVQINCRHVIC